MAEPDPVPDAEVLTRALREYHAAQNSLRRAHEEFQALIPLGLLVLHQPPGEVTDLYWRYQRVLLPDGRETFIWGTAVLDEKARAVIVEAPAPCEEYLPRLGADEARDECWSALTDGWFPAEHTEAAILEERAACARLADERAAQDVATAIRARG